MEAPTRCYGTLEGSNSAQVGQKRGVEKSLREGNSELLSACRVKWHQQRGVWGKVSRFEEKQRSRVPEQRFQDTFQKEKVISAESTVWKCSTISGKNTRDPMYT